MSWYLWLAFGITFGTVLGIVVCSLLIAAGESYSGPVAPDERDRDALS